MRHWSVLLLGAILLIGCPLEPLRVAGYTSGAGLRPGSLSTSQVAVRVPGLSGQDAAGLKALINGVPVPIVSTADGEVVLRLPPGYSGGEAVFELWRHGERIASRDIAAQLDSGVGVSHAGSPWGPNQNLASGGGNDRSPLVGDININVTVPNGSGSGSIVVTDGTGNGGNGNGNASPSPTPSPSPSPTPTSNPSPTPTPSATLVPVADQTPVPNGVGEVSGDVSF